MSKAKGGLGKGLSALIRPGAATQRTLTPQTEGPEITVSEPIQPAGGTVTHLQLNRIRPNPFQPRADFDQQALDELKDSIKQKGVIQAITVRRSTDGMYELISGERRYRASLELGLQTIPAYVMDIHSDEEMLELALVENLQREHLNPIEIAISYQRLINDVGLTIEDVATKVSKDRTTVTNSLRLLKLPSMIQQSLRKGAISAGHARALISIPDETVQLKLFERIVKKDLNVRQIEKLARDFGKKKEKYTLPLAKATPSAIHSIEERMQQILGTKVRIHLYEGGRGEVHVEFYSHDDLARLFDLLSTIEP